MRQNTFFSPTLRDVPNDAEVISHKLLLRAGYIRQSTSGVYSFLPLGLRVLRKVEAIIREEMDRAGAQELFMPAIQPAELWKESGRWDDYGDELFRLTDRQDREFALGATHEEVITDVIRDEVKSYKKLPMTLYQIQTKFRDERRPRFGLLRGREFLMKDAYSFDKDMDGLDSSYSKMYNAYMNVFERCQLNFRAVEADSGAMGGTDTHEFMVLSEVGEDTIAYSDSSDFAANIEIAPVKADYEKQNIAKEKLTKVETPNIKTIEEVSSFLEVSKERCIKSLFYIIDEQPVIVMVRGDHEVNEIKLKHILGASSVALATENETESFLHTKSGFIGPVQTGENIKLIADPAIAAIVNGVCGANIEDFHYVNVNADRDFPNVSYEDVRTIQEGDISPDGKGKIVFKKGIEVGHVFKLGTKYSEALGASYLDEQGKAKPIVMGSYGIGVSRVVAAIVEQHHDDNGIVWPKDISPFDVHIIPVNIKQDEQRELAEKLYQSLLEKKIDVLFDDRQERPGVKFKDSDLYGLPIRITVGKRANEGYVELKVRATGTVSDVHIDDLSKTVIKYLTE